MPRLNRNELNGLYRSNQVIRTDELLSILENYGWMHRRPTGGSSHIICWNPDYPEFDKLSIVAGTKNIRFQKIALNKCLKILDIEAKHKSAVKNISSSQTSATKEISTQTQLALPDYAEHFSDRRYPGKFIRHRQYPQFVFEINDKDTDETIKDRLDDLKEKAEKLDREIREARDEYDCEVAFFPNGTIVFYHEPQNMGIVLPPFTPRLRNYDFTILPSDLIGAIQVNQEGYESTIEGTKERYHLREKERRDGKRVFLQPNRFDPSIEYEHTLETTENGFVSELQLIRLMQGCENTSWKDLNKTLKQRRGITSKKNGDELVLTGIISETTYTLSTEDLLTPLMESLKDFDQLSKEEQDGYRQAVSNAYDTYLDRYNEMSRILTEENDCHSELLTRLRALGLRHKVSDSKNLKPGELGYCDFEVGDTMHRLQVLFIKQENRMSSIEKALQNNTKDYEITFMPTLETVETLENLVVAHKASLEAEKAAAPISQPPFSRPADTTKSPLGDVTKHFRPIDQGATNPPLPPFMQPNPKGPKNGKK